MRCLPMGPTPPGEYTDGILQLTVLESRAGLYPPLYGALARGLHWAAGGALPLEAAGRFLSNLAASLCILLVYAMGRQLAGAHAAWLGALLFAVAPLQWRWAERVMTDSLYMLLGTTALCALVQAWSLMRESSAEAEKMAASRWLGLAVFAGGMATLTRYQGILLAPLLGAGFVLYVRCYRQVSIHAIAAGLAWLLVPAWMYFNGFVHQSQFASRTGPTALATFGAWWNTLESFLLVSPYYFGYPVVAMALVGAMAARRYAAAWALRPLAITWAVYAVLLLGLQAAFGSFQYRYMLPLLPVVAALAGCGFVHAERKFRQAPGVPRWLLILSVIYLAFSTASVVFLQSGRAFQDQRQAADYIRGNIPADTAVFSNERYGSFTALGSIKASYWSGRTVKLLESPEQPLPDGSILMLSTAYGGTDAVRAIMQMLEPRYTLSPLTTEPFQSRLVPLLDDIMVNPMFNQNPTGWVMRYVPQQFATQLFRVDHRAAPEAQP